tara:strand:- start:17 stop:334 length:318 start_codon:yes stop_codon:yes gene_type:complete
MKLLITEEQVRLLMREFGEGVESRDAWLDGIYKLTSNPSFDTSEYEVVATGEDGEYLGYWDKEQNHGFVVNEYVDDNEIDEMISPESMQDYGAFFGDELKLTDLV